MVEKLHRVALMLRRFWVPPPTDRAVCGRGGEFLLVIEHDHLKLYQGHFRNYSEDFEALLQRSECRQ